MYEFQFNSYREVLINVELQKVKQTTIISITPQEVVVLIFQVKVNNLFYFFSCKYREEHI